MSSLLIVDDDASIREVLIDLFCQDYSCFETETAEAALQLLENEHIDVVLTDISMPGMSGLELLGHTRQRWPGTEVIMMSGIRDDEYAGGLMRMGAFDYMAKPFDLADITQSVARATGKSHHLPQTETIQVSSKAHQEVPEAQPMEVFSSILDKAFPLHELLEMCQRNQMTGYMKLSWDHTTIERARSMEMFMGAGGDFTLALESRTASIYVRDGLMIDAVVGESEKSLYWTDAEEALTMLVRLATFVSVGVCATGYVVSSTRRLPRLSVSNNAGKFLNIVAKDEEERDADDDGFDFERSPSAPGEITNDIYSEAMFTNNPDFDESLMPFLV
ncbi:MAG: response regulator [Pyrinomonadaceae bacterium]